MNGPRVHIAPISPDLVVDAVKDAGATVVSASQAEAIVWTSGDANGLRELLSEDVLWVQLPAAGIDSWIGSGMIDGSRVWTSAIGAYSDVVAEHAVALILACARRLHVFARQQAWAPELAAENRRIAGSTIVVVGAGSIGRTALSYLRPYKAHLIAVTRNGNPVPEADETAAAADISSVWPRAHFVIVAAPSTDATNRMIGKEVFEKLPAGACLVNVGRGNLIDADALLEALSAGRLGAAALDVTDPEPLPPGHPLWTHERVLITPHIANARHTFIECYARHVRENVDRFGHGRTLMSVIDPARGY